MSRKKTSFFEDLISLTAMMPPWVGLVLAPLSYFLCHRLSLIDTGQFSALEDMTKMVSMTVVRTFGMFGQFLFPIIFCCGALGSFVRRRRGNRLTQNIRKQPKHIDELSWREFELLVTTLLRESGFSVVDNLTAGADGGIDQILRKDGQKYLVQCKHWKAQKVSVSIIREMFGLMVAEDANEVWIVTSGSFTQEAKAFANQKPIKLIDGNHLKRLVVSDVVAEASSDYVPQPKELKCPKCSARMVKRTARRGGNVGNEFWGCSEYPKCRGIVSLT